MTADSGGYQAREARITSSRPVTSTTRAIPDDCSRRRAGDRRNAYTGPLWLAVEEGLEGISDPPELCLFFFHKCTYCCPSWARKTAVACACVLQQLDVDHTVSPGLTRLKNSQATLVQRSTLYLLIEGKHTAVTYIFPTMSLYLHSHHERTTLPVANIATSRRTPRPRHSAR